MGAKVYYLIVVLLVVCSSLVFAVPGIPHQFYGSIEVNNQPVPDNTVIIATVDGDQYITVTKDGKFGYAPNIFYVEDPDGDRSSETITFSTGGMDVGTWTFENNGYTQLAYSLTTTCGDNYCLGDETCSSCSQDCGQCTNPPIITIHSPENKIYDTTKVELKVTADQDIIAWLYSLNSGLPITFLPNITITAAEGSNSLTIIGINNVYQSGSSAVTFSVELPDICGDAICSASESCSSCPADCGACSTGGNSGGGSGGGGGGGGGSDSSGTTTTTTTTSTCIPMWVCTDWYECIGGSQNRICTDYRKCGTDDGKPAESQDCVVEEEIRTSNDNIQTFEENSSEANADNEGNAFSAITGAVIGGGASSWVALIILIAIISSILLFVYRKKRTKRMIVK